MAEVKWTLQAAGDLEAITEFIAQDSEYYAQLFAIDVLNAAERLVEFPESGRIVPEANNPSIREIIFGNYRIVYRFRKETVEILTRLLHELTATRAISAFATATSVAKVSARRLYALLKISPSTRRKVSPEQAPVKRGTSKPFGRILHDYSCNIRANSLPRSKTT